MNRGYFLEGVVQAELEKCLGFGCKEPEELLLEEGLNVRMGRSPGAVGRECVSQQENHQLECPSEVSLIALLQIFAKGCLISLYICDLFGQSVELFGLRSPLLVRVAQSSRLLFDIHQTSAVAFFQFCFLIF